MSITISTQGPELLDMFVGESERNVRELFQAGREAAPSVLFFDELDSLAPARGKGGDGGGVMDRVVSQLITEMDLLSAGGGEASVNVIGATNRPDLLDSSLLRRFDKKIYLPSCREPSAQVKVFEAQMRRYSLEEDVDLLAVCAHLPPVVTGADIYDITSRAYFEALKRKLADVERLSMASTNEPVANTDQVNSFQSSSHLVQFIGSLPRRDLIVRVSQADLLAAAATLKPSVSAEEAARYEEMARTFDTHGR